MYDTISIKLVNSNKDLDYISIIQSNLDYILSRGESIYGYYIIGYLGTLKVKAYKNMLVIKDCSISKYFFGNNIEMMSCGDMKKAIDSISNRLTINLDDAIVTRIDFGFSIVTNHPITAYLPFLGQSPYMDRLEQPNGLYFTNGIKQLAFYDKLKEAKQSRCSIPDIYTGKNLLRIELRFKKRIANQLKMPKIKVCDLYDYKFYNVLVRQLKKEYKSIKKLSPKSKQLTPTGCKKDLTDQLAVMSLMNFGQANVLNYIKSWQDQKLINKRQAFELRKHILILGDKNKSDLQDSLINELNEKVFYVSRFH